MALRTTTQSDMSEILGWIRMVIGACFIASVTVVAAADIEIEVRGVKPYAGPIYVALFDDPEDFAAATSPRASVNASGEIATGIFTSETLIARPPKERTTVQPTGRTVRFKFTDVTPGVYAVALYQDMNNDMRLGTSLSGQLLEPWGLSNNPKLPDRAATWEEVRFTLSSDSKVLVIDLQK